MVFGEDMVKIVIDMHLGGDFNKFLNICHDVDACCKDHLMLHHGGFGPQLAFFRKQCELGKKRSESTTKSS